MRIQSEDPAWRQSTTGVNTEVHADRNQVNIELPLNMRLQFVTCRETCLFHSPPAVTRLTVYRRLNIILLQFYSLRIRPLTHVFLFQRKVDSEVEFHIYLSHEFPIPQVYSIKDDFTPSMERNGETIEVR